MYVSVVIDQAIVLYLLLHVHADHLPICTHGPNALLLHSAHPPSPTRPIRGGATNGARCPLPAQVVINATHLPLPPPEGFPISSMLHEPDGISHEMTIRMHRA
jgi:hypothetical protein